MLFDGLALRVNHDVRQAHGPHASLTCQIYSHRSSQAAFFLMFQSILSARFGKPSQLGQVNQVITDGLY
jgi:hypothetical protein